jgi:PPM family protein phosphatase
VLRAYGLTDKGRIRPTNEDCFAIQEELGLCVVADGMGGHNAGEVAARLAVDIVVEIVRDRAAKVAAQRPPHGGDADAEPLETEEPWPFGYDATLSADGNLLRTAIHLANVQILETAMADGRYAGMGTTIVAARVTNGVLSVAHVGDSRLYLLSGGRLRPLTLDDSWMATMLAHDPQADPLLLQHHPMRNALTNVVGARPATDVHVVEVPLAGGEVLVLTTDGVHGAVDDHRMAELLQREDDLREMGKAIITSALARGSRDNCTAVIARYDG